MLKHNHHDKEEGEDMLVLSIMPRVAIFELTLILFPSTNYSQAGYQIAWPTKTPAPPPPPLLP